MANTWRNRIVRYAEVPPADLLANPNNWRVHPKHQQEVLKGVIDEVGYVDPILVQDGTDLVIDGHLRVSLALRDDVPTIPVQYVDLNDAEAALVLATFDPITAMAMADKAQLDVLLREVSTGEEAVQAMIEQLAAREGLIPSDDPYEHWKGMPEYENEDVTPVKRLTVSFATEDDYRAFGALVEQNLTEHTKWIWFPPRSESAVRYEDGN